MNKAKPKHHASIVPGAKTPTTATSQTATARSSAGTCSTPSPATKPLGREIGRLKVGDVRMGRAELDNKRLNYVDFDGPAKGGAMTTAVREGGGTMKFLGVDFSAHRPPRPADLVRLVEATNIAGRSLNALLELITSGKLRVYQHETERWSMVSRADLEKLLAGSKEPR